jgi:hypothetical protein
MDVALVMAGGKVMSRKSRSGLVVGALALAMLLWGPAASKLFAWDGGSSVAFYGSFPLPHGGVVVSSGYPHYGYSYAHPYYSYGYPYYRPYRLVRVFVPVPFPHWVYRRVYYSVPYGGYGYHHY